MKFEKYIEQMVLAESNYKLLFYNKVKVASSNERDI
jgi:hypothetical protein